MLRLLLTFLTTLPLKALPPEDYYQKSTRVIEDDLGLDLYQYEESGTKYIRLQEKLGRYYGYDYENDEFLIIEKNSQYDY